MATGSYDLSCNVKIHQALVTSVKLFQVKNPEWELENDIGTWITSLGITTLSDVKIVPYGQWFLMIVTWS